MPSQVFLSISPALRDFLRECRVEAARGLADEERIDMDEVYRFADEHQKLGGDIVKVHELLEGSEVVSRKKASEAHLTELERLRLDAEERKYQRMVEKVAPTHASKRHTDNSIEGLSWATNFGTQVLVAFVGAFALGYFFVETFVSTDMTVKVIAGAGCSFLTLLLETCLLVVHESKTVMIDKKLARREEEATKRSRLAAARRAGVGLADGAAGGGAEATNTDGVAPRDPASPQESPEDTDGTPQDDGAQEEAAEPKKPDEKKKD